MKKTVSLGFAFVLILVPLPVLGGEKGMQVLPTSAAKYAVLVGVNDYEKCDDLRYCKADVTALAEQLAAIGFDRRDIVVLTDGEELRPNRRNILEQLDATRVSEDSISYPLVSGGQKAGRFFLLSSATCRSVLHLRSEHTRIAEE